MALKLVPLQSLTYDYSYLHAILNKEDDLHINQESIKNLLRALEISIASNDSSGIFLTMLKIVELALMIATQLKYNGA